jgi:hypothetical protein
MQLLLTGAEDKTIAAGGAAQVLINWLLIVHGVVGVQSRRDGVTARTAATPAGKAFC